MHEVSAKKKEFQCEECEEVFRQEANLLNHRKCSGEEASGRERRKCACGKEFSKSYYTKHRQMCPAVVEAVVQMRPRVYKRRELRVDVE